MSDDRELRDTEELLRYIGKAEEPGDIIMYTADQEMLRLKNNGDILVKGHKAGNNEQVVDAFREFVMHSTTSRFIPFSRVREPGIYINFRFNQEIAVGLPTLFDLQYKEYGHPNVFRLTHSGSWVSMINTKLEPEFFKEGLDFFVGPIKMEAM